MPHFPNFLPTYATVPTMKCKPGFLHNLSYSIHSHWTHGFSSSLQPRDAAGETRSQISTQRADNHKQ